MNAKQTRAPQHAPLLTLGDIYYILFRHKWKIIISAGVGLLVALILPLVWPKVYQSEAKLLIKYVLDNRVPTDPTGTSQRVSLPDATGRNIINTELQILTSFDLAQQVATNVTAAKILGKDGSPAAAAAVIHAGLLVENLNNSDVIRISFKHSDPAVVQQVLDQMIKCYLDRHAEIHRPGGAYDEFFTRETDKLRDDLARTEDSLRNAKTNLEIVTVDDSRKTFSDQITRIEQEIFDADAELAGHQAKYEELSKQNPAAPESTNSASTTNVAAVATVPSDKASEYKRVCDLLSALRDKQKSLLLNFLPENSLVKDVQQRIVDTDKQKKQIEAEFPGVIAQGKVAAEAIKNAGNDSTANLQNDLMAESAQIAALQKRVEVLTNHLADVKAHSAALEAKAGTISQLELTRKMQQQRYEYYQTSLENSQIDEAFGAGKNSNISTIETPLPPFMDKGKMYKACAAVALVGILFGLGLAFLIELYLDHSLKRPSDIETRLSGVPLFLSIPYRNGESKMRLLKEPPKTELVLKSDALERSIPLNGGKITIGRNEDNSVTIDNNSISAHHCELFSRNGDIVIKDVGSAAGTFVDGQRVVEMTLQAGQTFRAGTVEFRVEVQEPSNDLAVATRSVGSTPPWDPRHALRPFYDTLRDRLITYFEVKNLTHNPKLVALTSCGERAGVTSTAAGLAAALSETGEGNVLLVDMNVERGAAHHFHKGHLSCGIDEALVKEKRHEARVQENLYVVTEATNEDSLPRVLPKRFTSLVPKLKASDYDYIIFDMPPMSQISITPRLARFMDMVMVVVESEKTDRDVVQRAVSMLTESKANVGIVLNKRKTYIPEALRKEL